MKNFFSFLFTQFYFLTLGLYTFYGVFKSGNEYFCFQNRPDNPDYRYTFKSQVVNITNMRSGTHIISGVNGGIYNLEYEGERVLKDNFGNKTFQSYHVYKPGGNFGNKIEYGYLKNGSWFDLSCEAINEVDDYPPYFVDNEYHNFYRGSFKMNELGYLEESYRDTIVHIDNQTSVLKNLIKCDLSKSPFTCSTRVETTNNFFLFYLAITSFYFSFCFLTLTTFKQKLFRRIAFSLMKFFNKGYGLEFCNPITGEPIFVKKGEKIKVLTNSRGPLINNNFISSLKDLNGEYEMIRDKKILVKTKDYKGFFELDEVGVKLLESYFFEIRIDERCCVVDSSNCHYLQTLEVIRHVANGGGIGEVESCSDTYVLTIKEFEMNYLRGNFSIPLKEAGVFLKHNWNFFSQSYNMDCLFNCLKSRAWSSDAPKGVKNSQWKLYTSDFKQIAKIVSNKNYKCQKVSKLTKSGEDALKYWDDVQHLDNKDFRREIKPLPTESLCFSSNQVENQGSLPAEILVEFVCKRDVNSYKFLKFPETSSEDDDYINEKNLESVCKRTAEILQCSNDACIDLNVAVKEVLGADLNLKSNEINKVKKLEAVLKKKESLIAISQNLINKNENKIKEAKELLSGYKEALLKPVTVTVNEHIVDVNFLKSEMNSASSMREKKKVRELNDKISYIKRNPSSNIRKVEKDSDWEIVKKKNLNHIKKMFLDLEYDTIKLSHAWKVLQEVEADNEDVSDGETCYINKEALFKEIFTSKKTYQKSGRGRGKKKQVKKRQDKFTMNQENNNNLKMKNCFKSADFETNLIHANKLFKVDKEANDKRCRPRTQYCLLSMLNRMKMKIEGKKPKLRNVSCKIYEAHKKFILTPEEVNEKLKRDLNGIYEIFCS